MFTNRRQRPLVWQLLLWWITSPFLQVGITSAAADSIGSSLCDQLRRNLHPLKVLTRRGSTLYLVVNQVAYSMPLSNETIKNLTTEGGQDPGAVELTISESRLQKYGAWHYLTWLPRSTQWSLDYAALNVSKQQTWAYAALEAGSGERLLCIYPVDDMKKDSCLKDADGVVSKRLLGTIGDGTAAKMFLLVRGEEESQRNVTLWCLVDDNYLENTLQLRQYVVHFGATEVIFYLTTTTKPADLPVAKYTLNAGQHYFGFIYNSTIHLWLPEVQTVLLFADIRSDLLEKAPAEFPEQGIRLKMQVISYKKYFICLAGSRLEPFFVTMAIVLVAAFGVALFYLTIVLIGKSKGKRRGGQRKGGKRRLSAGSTSSNNTAGIKLKKKLKKGGGKLKSGALSSSNSATLSTAFSGRRPPAASPRPRLKSINDLTGQAATVTTKLGSSVSSSSSSSIDGTTEVTTSNVARRLPSNKSKMTAAAKSSSSRGGGVAWRLKSGSGSRRKPSSSSTKKRYIGKRR